MIIIVSWCQKILQYRESNWLYEEGLETHSYNVTFEDIKSRCTIEEQEKRPERLSLVKFFENNQNRQFIEICNNFQKVNTNFYFDQNKKFHSTLLGFQILNSEYYDMIAEKVKHFSEGNHMEMSIKFDVIRLGTKYENNNALNPIKSTSNGTIIALGDTLNNKRFTSFGNNLASFLLNDNDLIQVLGKKLRRRFPNVWCTLGCYLEDFKINSDLETLFNEYLNLQRAYFQMPCTELELGKSSYGDLRDWKSIKKYSVGI